jgi:hypothetical protein
VPVSYPGDLYMRHRAPRPLIDLLRRLPRATARPLEKAARLSPGRALVALIAVLGLGTGAFAVTSTLSEPPKPQAGPAAFGQRHGPAASRDGGRPDLVETPTSSGPASHGGPSESKTSAAAQTRAAQSPNYPDSVAPSTAIGGTPTPRTEVDRASGWPSTGSATRSTSPSPPSDASSSPTREDQTPPVTTISERKLLDADAALFAFSADEPATFTCSLDGAAYVSCDSPTTYSDLESGWHTLAVRATDTALNVDPSPAEVRWHASEGRLTDRTFSLP